MSARALNVLHLIDAVGLYGAAAVVLELSKQQQLAGLNVTVLCFRRPNEPEKTLEKCLRDAGVQVESWPITATPSPLAALKLFNFVRDMGADIAHCHGYKSNILLGLLPKRFLSCPVVSTIHGYTAVTALSMKGLYYWLDGIALKSMNKVFVVSASTRAQLPNGIEGNKICLIHNGIAESAESRQVNAKALDAPFIVGTLGRLAEEKNYAFLIKGFAAWMSEHSPERKVQLRIAGEGAELSNLQELIETLGVGKSVQLVGYKSDTADFIAGLNLYANSSTTEGLPISLLEVMRRGCPIVASNIGANRELLAGECLAEFFEPKELPSLLAALERAYLKTSEERQKLVKRQKNVFLAHYTSKRMERAYYTAYQECTNKQQNSRRVAKNVLK